MLAKLIDLAIEFVTLFQVFVYVDHFEEAVVLRMGRYARTIGPGLHFILPMGVEDIISVNVKPEPLYLDPQSLHTKDDYLVNVQVGITFRVIDPRTHLLEFEATDSAIAMLVSGYVAEAIQRANWSELRDGVWLRGLKTRANRMAHKRGAHIEELIVQDLASGSANRLWIEGIDGACL